MAASPNGLAEELDNLNRILDEAYASKESSLNEMLDTDALKYLDSLLKEVRFKPKGSDHNFVAQGIDENGNGNFDENEDMELLINDGLHRTEGVALILKLDQC